MNTELRNTTDILKEYLSYIKDDTQVKKVRTGFNKLDNLLIISIITTQNIL